MNQPLVSICIPVFNTVHYIEETINCFLSQSYKNIEIIIQDDCSTDGTFQLLLEKYSKNTCIKLYRNELNKGVGENWNLCYEKSSGDYIIMANADDIYCQNFISQSIFIFNQNQLIDVVQFGHEILFDNNHYKKYSDAQIGLNNGLIHDAFNLIFFSNPFLFQFAISKRSILEKAKLSNTNKKLFLHTQICDLELQIRIAKIGGNIYFQNEALGIYRRHDSNISLSRYGEKKSYYEIIDLYHDYLKLHYKRNYIKRRFWEVRILIVDLIKFPMGFNYRLLFKSLYFLIK